MEKYYLDKNSTALLVIDMQEKLFPTIDQNEKLIKPNQTLITAAQAFNLPIYATEQYPKGLGTTIPELKERLDALHVKFQSKTSFTACLPEIMQQIKADQVDTILISGIEAHVCVFQTTRDLLKYGYKVHIVADAVGSSSPVYKETALKMMAEMGAVITNSETAAFDLLKDSKAEQFKAISNAVK